MGSPDNEASPRPQRRVRRDRNDGLSIAECRKLLPAKCALSDEEILRARNQLYDLAHVVVSLLPSRVLQEAVEERAAIMEIDGHLPRAVARRKAFSLVSRGER